MRRINHCLNKQLSDICLKVAQIEDINMKVHQYLPSDVRDSCRVGSFNKGCLLLVTEKPAYATALRYCLPELRDNLRKAGLYQLMSIKIQIIENHQPPASINKVNEVRVKELSPLQGILNHLADIK